MVPDSIQNMVLLTDLMVAALLIEVALIILTLYLSVSLLIDRLELRLVLEDWTETDLERNFAMMVDIPSHSITNRWAYEERRLCSDKRHSVF